MLSGKIPAWEELEARSRGIGSWPASPVLAFPWLCSGWVGITSSRGRPRLPFFGLFQGSNLLGLAYWLWLRWVFTLRLTSGQGLPKEGQEYGPLPGTRRGEHFRFWQQFLRQSLDLTRREGHPLQGKLDYLLDEITRQRSQALAQFLKKMELLRFFISILVFLSSYFAFVYWLLTSMWPASL